MAAKYGAGEQGGAEAAEKRPLQGAEFCQPRLIVLRLGLTTCVEHAAVVSMGAFSKQTAQDSYT